MAQVPVQRQGDRGGGGEQCFLLRQGHGAALIEGEELLREPLPAAGLLKAKVEQKRQEEQIQQQENQDGDIFQLSGFHGHLQLSEE